MFTNLLPAEATHTTLDLFEKQSLLVTFDNAFTQLKKLDLPTHWMVQCLSLKLWVTGKIS